MGAGVPSSTGGRPDHDILKPLWKFISRTKKKRLRENTWFTKEHIIRTKILPYFKEKRLSEIKPRDVIAWQNEMLNYRDKNGKAYSPTYLKTLHGQLSAILNHAVRFYGLKSNAAATAGCMGSEKHKEMLFWTKEEYLKFAEVMMDKPQSYYAFEALYWCGIREGELAGSDPGRLLTLRSELLPSTNPISG